MRARGWILWVIVLVAGQLVGAALHAQGPSREAALEQLYGRGVAAFQAGDAYRTLELLGQVAERDPAYRDVQKLLGQARLVIGQLPAAKDHFERALEQDPRDGHAAFLLGLALHRASRFVEAIPALDRALRLAPGNPNPLIYRGLSHLRLGRPEEARRDLKAALERSPGDATARTALAELEWASGEVAAAERRVRGVLEEAPDSVEARILLGQVLLDRGEAAAAVPELQRARELSPHRSDIVYLLARALLRSGQEEAGRGRLAEFQERRRREERIRILEVAVRSEPEAVERRLELVDLLLEDGQVGRAVPHLATLLRQRPGDERVTSRAERLRSLREKASRPP